MRNWDEGKMNCAQDSMTNFFIFNKPGVLQKLLFQL